MRILFLGNNWGGWQILKWLASEGEQIVGLVLHPSDKRRYGDEILEVVGAEDTPIFDGSQLRSPFVVNDIRNLHADIGISAFFGYILRNDFLDLMPAGCINIHPAFLPYNRGSYPNVWSIIDETPAGVTIHYIDEGVDTGDIIAQQEVPVEIVDTGASLYQKLEQASVILFQETWPLIRAGVVSRKAQHKGEGTHHFRRDVAEIDVVDLDRRYVARELINILRARTFPPYYGAYIKDGSRKIHMRLEFSIEETDSDPAL